MRTAFVWPVNVPTGDLGFGAHLGTHVLAYLCDLDTLIWHNGESAPLTVRDYDCLIVNLFAGSQHISQIRALHPRAYIIGVPDATFDEIFIGTSTADMLFLQQLQATDCIGYVSESNRQFYSALFPDKPTVKIPVAIGQDGFFKAMRAQEKEDFIITCDHPDYNGVDYSIQNVAAVAAIQRATGLPVVYTNASPKTPEYAKFAGLRAEYKSKLVPSDYARLAARARLGVDMYVLHGFGRNGMMMAYCGTPLVGSECTNFDLETCDPWKSEYAKEIAIDLLENDYEVSRSWGVERVENFHSFDACRKQMFTVLNEVEQWHLTQQP